MSFIARVPALATLAVLWLWSEALLALAGGLRGGARTAVFALCFVATVVLVPLAAIPAWRLLASG